MRVCVAIHDVAANRGTRSDDAACATRLPPASTFKIPHALVALETGVVTATSVERWDGTAYPGRPAWQRDHTVGSAMRPSVVWFFQRIAPRVGAERMHAWLTRVGYGNADTSGPVTAYWLNGRLRVSPDEQLQFLRRFFAADLPVAAPHLAIVEASLTQEPGTVENATGIHQLGVTSDHRVRLTAKTGATRADDGTGVSWLVGRLSVDGHDHVFATAAWRENGAVDPLEGARVATRAMIERGWLSVSPPGPGS
jgi:beta-lactamase class D